MKQLLASEKGMQLVNALFFLSMLSRHNGMIFVAYGAWIIYLRYCIRKTTSSVTRKIYKGFVVFATVMILLNLVFYINALAELF